MYFTVALQRVQKGEKKTNNDDNINSSQAKASNSLTGCIECSYKIFFKVSSYIWHGQVCCCTWTEFYTVAATQTLMRHNINSSIRTRTHKIHTHTHWTHGNILIESIGIEAFVCVLCLRPYDILDVVFMLCARLWVLLLWPMKIY